MQEGTVDFFLSEIGACLDDFVLARAANGKLGVARVMFHLHNAQLNVLRWAETHGAHKSQLVRKVTITEDSENDDRYFLPPRTWGVFAVEDDNGIQYIPLGSRKYYYQAGFIVERQASTNRYNNRAVVRFVNYQPTGSIYAWVLEEPVRMSAGDGTYAATTAVLEASPDAGETILDDDYYIGAQLMITQSGAAAFGLIGTATDYVASTRTLTMPTWSTTPTAQDDYSIMCELPRITWRLVVLEAARLITRVDRRLERYRPDILEEMKEVQESTLLALRKPVEHFDNMPRQLEIWLVGGL